MITVRAHGDRAKESRWHTAMPAVVCALGLIVSATATGNTVLALIGLTLAAAGASTAQVSFWTLPASFLGGVAAGIGARELAWQHRWLCKHLCRWLDG
jgi:hypothetical protein